MKRHLIFLGILFICSVLIWRVSALEPSGAEVNSSLPESAINNSAGSVPAQAGNVTELNIFGYSSTQSWQGYFGNVSGVLQLSDGLGHSMYNWTLAQPKGEVYASTNSTIYWPNIQCFNFSAKGNYVGSETPGGTNLYGMNISQLQSQYNISSDDVDAVNETFIYSGAGGHNTFYTASEEFSAGECQSTRVYDSSGTGVGGHFEEVLLYEPVSRSVIFTSLLEKGGEAGFNGRKFDFEMLVLENGHGTDQEATNYYFYVELQ